MLDTKKIDTIIWDLDQTLYPYWGEVATSFAFYTATSAMSKIKTNIKPSMDELTDMAQQSYDDHGITTRVFHEKYNIDELSLYQDHHKRMFRDLLKPQWADNVPHDDHLIGVFNKLQSREKSSYILTNGTNEWADEITKLIGIRDTFEAVRGADDYGLNLKGQEGHQIFKEFLGEFMIKPYKPGDYSNVLLVEDSPTNMICPKQTFNMQTALVKTDRVQADDTLDVIDQVFPSAMHVGIAILVQS